MTALPPTPRQEEKLNPETPDSARQGQPEEAGKCLVRLSGQVRTQCSGASGCHPTVCALHKKDLAKGTRGRQSPVFAQFKLCSSSGLHLPRERKKNLLSANQAKCMWVNGFPLEGTPLLKQTKALRMGDSRPHVSLLPTEPG